MLKLFDKEHNAIGHLVKYKDCKKESDVATGDKTLSFVYLAKHHVLETEMYLQTREDEYVIKEISESSDGFPQIIAALNLEELEAKPWQEFSVTDSTVDEAARTALAGTGWTIGICNVTKRRNAGMVHVTSLGVIQNLCAAFMCEPVFDTLSKTVSFYEKRGEDKGVYFMSGLNLKKLQKKATSYDFYTRIIPVGADGLTIESVNDGKNYLENYQYSDKVRTYIWKDESYTDPQALMEDAALVLEERSKPERSYSAEVRDLAKQKPEYSILSYSLGDTVRIVDPGTGTMEDQRIMRMVEYEDDPEKNTCEIANTFLTFEEMQQKFQAAAEIVNYTISQDGKIKVSDILKFEQGIANSSVVGGINSSIASMQGELAQVKLIIGQVETNYLKADEADLKYATIANLNVTNETVHSIQGDYASFKTTATQELAAQSGIIDNLSGQFSSFQTTMSQELVAAKGWMAEGSIGNAQISDLDANKLNAGTIDTALVTIAGTDGRLQISDNTIQISDSDHVRVQVGKDASGDYTLAVWDAAGNLIWDALGATENTIQRKIIRDRMVADDAAIQALKIDFQSFETALTDQGIKISGTVVQVGDKTLNVALSEQTQVISEHSETLTEQTQLISEHGETLTDHATRITANENAIKLTVSTQEFTTYQSTMTGQISAAKSEAIGTAASDATTKANNALASAKADATTKADNALASAQADATAKANQALADAKTYTNAQVTTVNSHLTTIDSSIDILQDQIALKVEQTDIDTAVESIQVGGRNLLLDSKGDFILATKNTGAAGDNYNYQRFYATMAFGEAYTVSADLEITDGDFNSVSICPYPGQSPVTVAIPANGRIVHTFKKTADTVDSVLIYAGIAGATRGQGLIIRNIKLEKGTRATDWTPAPEDVDSAIIAVDNKFTSYSTTTQMQAAITAAKNSITSTVSQTYATKTELSTANGKISSLETWKAEASQKITKDGIVATVGNYYAYQSDLSAAENRIASAESTITQQADEIALKVEKNGVISAINQTAETVQISADKIDLSGYVTISGLAAQGATVINGANITTGIISADRIDVTGLFAKDITATGTIRGVTLEGATGSFSGSVTTSNIIATGGRIANFLVSGGYLYNGINIGTAGSCGISCGSSLGGSDDYMFWAGNGVFRVNKNGAAWMTNANITGSIEATSMLVKTTLYLFNPANTAQQTAISYSGSRLVLNGDSGENQIGSGVLSYGNLHATGIISANTEIHAYSNLLVGPYSGIGENHGVYIGSYGNSNGYLVYLYNGENSGNLWLQTFLDGGWKWYSISRTAASATSDIRLKDNIIDSAVDALSTVKRIKIRSFTRNDSNIFYKIGVVADELEEIDELLVHGGGYTPDGKPAYKTVNVLHLSSYAIKAIQELSQEVEQIDLLKSKNEALQSQLNNVLARISEQDAEIARLRGMIQAA